ncbi:hypothetical protein HYH03_008038 [Edaphochlamys debaryana]|uniref:EF-hand domain-containing protein n=1 Tax=Edaphochlamys debaryana TaxID=47281 RepID=A0A835Y7G3_9CHLO|nr:hypothetical protein HYH03_008038 [Edaphochlamys debaryana]|eukprot:KAG2493820.1 hypothetical protein HYH03_008038 [Edaphochlamys debaryana]
MAPDGSRESDRGSVAGSHRSSVSRMSRSSKRGVKKAPPPPPPEPVEEPKTPFTQSMLAAGLSQLGRTADGLKPAYLAVRLEGTDLGTADPLSSLPHLQSVTLVDNRLTEIRALGALRNLTHIDVSGNKLTQVLDLRLGPAGSGPTNLRSADFSRNSLDMLADLAPFSRLTRLAVAGNRIDRIGAGLRQLRLLKILDLSNNRLVSIRGLAACECLRELRLSHNALQSLEPLAGLPQLQVLVASHNRLAQLRGTESLCALRTLDVSCNALGRLEELAAVRDASLLGTLDVRGNPLDRAMSLRLHVVHLLPQVVLLDGVAVEAKEKVLAANMHGADAEGLRLIRRKYFPNGELDDGGGAIPPLAAGLVASQAEEEAAADGTDRSALVRLDAWAASVRPESVLAPGGSLVSLADQLASVCAPPRPVSVTAAVVGAAAASASGGGRSVGGGTQSGGAGGGGGAAQLQRARVCWRWVVHHVASTAKLATTWDVDQPLFGRTPQAVAIERVLLGDPSAPPSPPPPPPIAGAPQAPYVPPPPPNGTWAERVARLFALLCRACELEAVPIPGYWKHAALPPGERVLAHNHCWAGVKVNGRWRLVDPTAAALAGGHYPFYVPPDAFIYSYWPLEAAWQLLPEPLAQEVWWQLPYASTAFFAVGCQLGDHHLAAVNTLKPIREGCVLPAFAFSLAAPRAKGTHVALRLREARSRRVVAEWPPREPGVPAYAFQQVVAGKRGQVEVRFGADSHLAHVHQMWTSLPGPGEYEVEVAHIREAYGAGPTGGLLVPLQGLPGPGLRLRVVDEQLMMRVKVVLPPILPHDFSEDGILHSPAVLRTPLPYASDYFTDAGCQLVSPPPNHPLEADRAEFFNVVLPGGMASRVGLMAEGLDQPIELQAVDEEKTAFSTSLQVPRASACTLVAYVHNSALESCAWVPLVQIRILPQSQHMVYTPVPVEVPEVMDDDPAGHFAREIFRAMDKNVDGCVCRREILAAFRRNRQHADILKCPPRIRQNDGTFDKFIDIFLQIDSTKLGTFTFNELAAYMGVLPSGFYEYTDSEDGGDFESGEGDDGDLDAPDEEGGGEAGEGGEQGQGGDGGEAPPPAANGDGPAPALANGARASGTGEGSRGARASGNGDVGGARSNRASGTGDAQPPPSPGILQAGGGSFAARNSRLSQTGSAANGSGGAADLARGGSSSGGRPPLASVGSRGGTPQGGAATGPPGTPPALVSSGSRSGTPLGAGAPAGAGTPPALASVGSRGGTPLAGGAPAGAGTPPLAPGGSRGGTPVGRAGGSVPALSSVGSKGANPLEMAFGAFGGGGA